jgi:hypothetical protein
MVPGYPSCYSLGYADGKKHPGTSCPGGHSQNYCNGYRAGAGSLISKVTTNGSASLQVDVAHCDQPGWPSYYSVGYAHGKAHPGTPCPIVQTFAQDGTLEQEIQHIAIVRIGLHATV